jgi:hypothetical protein
VNSFLALLIVAAPLPRTAVEGTWAVDSHGIEFRIGSIPYGWEGETYFKGHPERKDLWVTGLGQISHGWWEWDGDSKTRIVLHYDGRPIAANFDGRTLSLEYGPDVVLTARKR